MLVPVINLLLSGAKLNLFACSLKMDLGPRAYLPLLLDVIRSFIGGEQWWGIAGRNRFASLFACPSSSSFWAWPFSPDVFPHLAATTWVHFSRSSPCGAPFSALAAWLASLAPESRCTHGVSRTQSLKPAMTLDSGGSAFSTLPRVPSVRPLPMNILGRRFPWSSTNNFASI